MAGGIAGCLLLGGLFLLLAVRRYRQSACWRGAVHIPAVVKSVRYHEVWLRKTEISEHESSTEATLCFADQGKTYEKRRQFPGIVNAPAQGQTVSILFKRNSGDWTLRKEARTHWRLFLVLGCLCIAAGLALLLDGPGVLADLASYRADTPNLTGSVVCALIGLLTGVCACTCIRWLMPDLIQTTAAPVVWMVTLYVLHQCEEIDALCVGGIRQELGDDVHYYPFFQYSVENRQFRWFPRHQMSPKRYRAGSWYTLYHDPGTGKCALKPAVRDLVSALLSLIPIGFFTMLLLSLAVFTVGVLYIAGAGFLSVLAA